MTKVAVASDDDPFAALRALARARRELEHAEAVQVRRARLRGMSWPEIASALGVRTREVRHRHRGTP